MYPLNPLLVQTLIDGISVSSNRPIRQHWLDFVLMAIPQFQPTLQSIVQPLTECFGRQTLLLLQDLQRVSSNSTTTEDVESDNSDADFVMLLNGLERLIFLNLASSWNQSTSSEDDGVMPEKMQHQQESGGLLGYVSNVFSSDGGTTHEDPQFTVCLSYALFTVFF